MPIESHIEDLQKKASERAIRNHTFGMLSWRRYSQNQGIRFDIANLQ